MNNVTNFLTPQDNDVAMKNIVTQEHLLHQLQSARLAKNITKEIVAERLGISVEEVDNIEKGRYELTLTELRLVAIAYDVVISYHINE